MSDLSRDKLSDVLRANYPGFQSLVSFERLSGGASQETYCIVVQGAGGEEKLAMRRQAGGVFQSPSHERCGLKVEAEMMQLARSVDVPAPKIHHVLTREDDIGDGFIMEWLDGFSLGARIVKVPELSDIRPKLAGLYGEVAARIHSIDVRETGLNDKLPRMSPEQYVQQTWDRYKALGTPQPMIDYVGTWLSDRLPTEYEPGLVHNDFRNGNIMVDGNGVVAVLDWEGAHVGDPMRDLGWVCTNSWRYGKSELPVGGVGTREDFFAGYERVSGKKVDPDHVKFWEVFGTFWWACTCIGMAHTFRVGLDRSIERAAIGRRTSECQVDSANLLMPGPVELVPPAALGPDLEVPQAEEILESSRDLLHGQLMDETTGRTNFLARVAGNALGIVLREMQIGPEARRRELDRYHRVLGIKGELVDCRWQLVEGLRNRSIPLDTPGLQDHLRNTVVNQLAIDQPKYSGLRMALAGNPS